jgi:hypothetical protein
MPETECLSGRPRLCRSPTTHVNGRRPPPNAVARRVSVVRFRRRRLPHGRFDPAALNAPLALTTLHAGMLMFVLTDDQRPDLIAYILSLQ